MPLFSLPRGQSRLYLQKMQAALGWDTAPDLHTAQQLAWTIYYKIHIHITGTSQLEALEWRRWGLLTPPLHWVLWPVVCPSCSSLGALVPHSQVQAPLPVVGG